MPFYAVKRGKKTGIFNDWATVSDLVVGFSGAQHKKFSTKEAAEAYLNSGLDVAKSFTVDLTENTSHNPIKSMTYFAVKKGREPGVYREVEELHAQIEDFDGALYKRFHDEVDALKYVFGPEGRTKASESRSISSDTVMSLKRKFEENEPQKRPKGDIKVFSDGCCLGNGKSSAKAGVGVFFGTDDARNISEPLRDMNATNQRAELMAAIRALEVIEPRDGVVEICTDSNYTVMGITEWINAWRKNDYKDNTVKNRDLFERLDHLVNQKHCGRVKFTHVRGHSGIFGNEIADQLANDGASKPW